MIYASHTPNRFYPSNAEQHSAQYLWTRMFWFYHKTSMGTLAYTRYFGDKLNAWGQTGSLWYMR